MKECLLVCAEDQQQQKKFEAIRLGRNTITRRIQEMAENVTRQLQDLCHSFITFSLAVDESTDISGTPQVAIFIRGVNENLIATEELLDFCPLKDTTTGEDIMSCVEEVVDNLNLDWTKLVSVSTDGAPAMAGRNTGFVGRLRRKLGNLAVPQEIDAIHCTIHQQNLCAKSIELEHVMSVVVKTTNFIRTNSLKRRQFRILLEDVNWDCGELPLHTEVRWLSRGKILDRFFNLREEISHFMDAVDRPVPELVQNNWLCDLGFMSDLADHLNVLNLELQGKDNTIVDCHKSICAFEAKIELWKTQLNENNVSQFPKLESIITPDKSTDQYKNTLKKLGDEFAKRFGDIKALQIQFQTLSNPFSIDINTVSPALQLELLNLRSDLFMKEKFFIKNDLNSFYKNFPKIKYPHLYKTASKILAMFGTTYLCEQLFSNMKKTKSSGRASLKDYNLRCSLMLSAHRNLAPDIPHLVKQARQR